MVGYEHLRVVSPYRIKTIESIKLNWQPNEHGALILRGIVDDMDKANAVLKASSEDVIEVKASLESGEQTIFKGIISKVTTIHRSGVYLLEIEAMSGTSILDVQKRRRSFQNKDMTYGALVKKILESYSGYDVIHLVGSDDFIGEPIVQYDETDWELLKRVASHFQTVVISDILEEKPRLYIGVPKLNAITLPTDIPYTASKNLLAYEQANGAASSGLHHTDFFHYEVQSEFRYNIGNEVEFRDKAMVISGVKASTHKGTLVYTYCLARKEGIQQQRIHNKKLSGVSINGEVLDVQGEKVKLHLEIDSKQSKSEAYWFPFAPPTGNVMYCMPKAGTSATLYFPNDRGSKSRVTGCVRTNGADCAKTGNPNNRYFGTEHGSELELTPTAINVVSGSKEPLLISFDDASGVIIKSHRKLTMNAAEEISLTTPKRILIKTTNLIMAKKLSKLSGFTIEGEYHVLGDQVNSDGSDRTAYTKYQDEPATWTPPEPEPEKFNWGKLFNVVAAVVAVVVVVSLVVAATVVTGGVAGAILMGAACGAVGAVGATVAKDIARGEMSSGTDYLKSVLIGGFVGAFTGALFGPIGGTVPSLMPATTTQLASQYGTMLATGYAGSVVDYSLTEILNGRTPTFQNAMTAGLNGALFTGAFALLGPVKSVIQKAFSRGIDFDFIYRNKQKPLDGPDVNIKENPDVDVPPKDMDEIPNGNSGRTGKDLNRIFREATDADLDSMNAIYKKYNASPSKNVATTKGNIGGNSIDLESVSGKIDSANPTHKGNFTTPEKNYYTGSNNRLYDSEQKMIEHLRETYKDTPNIGGEIEIVSYRKICDGCNDIIDQFDIDFPNITIKRVQILIE